MSTALVWFRSDLRLTENPAWAAATSDHERVVALFVLDPALWHGCGVRRRAQLGANLAALDQSLSAWGGRLRVRRGDPRSLVPEEAAAVEAVYWNGDAGPYAADRDGTVAARIRCRVEIRPGNFVHGPGRVVTDRGSAYRVFGPFYRRWSSAIREPWPEPGQGRVAADPGDGLPDCDEPPMPAGERGAEGRLEAFLGKADLYADERDLPFRDGTSRLSADLKFGTISPRAVADLVGDSSPGRRAFLRQLAWRDFFAHLMAAAPRTRDHSARPQYEGVRWRVDPEGFAAWAAGQTGFPMVDAGMRQLAAEGWIHGRVRMVAASFLVKDLLVDWRLGERHFRRQLIDGDVAQNVGNWQWVAGTGYDAAPYFRILNPVVQSRRLDPEGEYLRRWVPELSRLPSVAIHAPWEAGSGVLARAGVVLGETYPAPMVDHAEARRATLAAYGAARSGG
jgi:deoxyribodipyrimidine photo-lyase